MGFVYTNQWSIKSNLEIDYVIKCSDSCQEMSNVPIEDIWVDVNESSKLLSAAGKRVKKDGRGPCFKSTWTISVDGINATFCPVTEFIYHAALKSTSKHSSLFRDILHSLTSVTLASTLSSQNKQNLKEYEVVKSEVISVEDFVPIYDVKPVDDDDMDDDEDYNPYKELAQKKQMRKTKEIAMARVRQQSDYNGDGDFDLNDFHMDPMVKIEDGSKMKLEPEDNWDSGFINNMDDDNQKQPKTPAKKIQCKICKKVCLGKIRIYKHYIFIHPDQPELHPPEPAKYKPDKQKTCSLCGDLFYKMSELYQHCLMIHPDQPEHHPEPPVQKLHPCTLCHEVCERKVHLYKHYKAVHPDQPSLHPPRPSLKTHTDNPRFYCKGCTKGFLHKIWLYKHCLQEHPNNPEILPSKPATSREVRLMNLHERGEDYKCGLPECAAIFTHFKGLARHERTHNGAFICIVCGKPCYSSEGLIDHCDVVHKEKADFMCRVCGFFTISESHLKVHTVEKHMEGTKMNVCDTCGYKSSSRSTFTNHMRMHEGKVYMCEECGKEFNSPQAIATHRRSHVPQEEYRYKCPVCDKRFPHASILAIHKRVHTGEKPFKCKDCGQSFGSQSSLIKHNRNLHVAQDDMPYKCEECGKTFSKARRKVYFCHLKQHSGVRDHICPLCQSAFSSRGYLGNHFKKVHKQKLFEVEKQLKLKLAEMQAQTIPYSLAMGSTKTEAQTIPYSLAMGPTKTENM